MLYPYLLCLIATSFSLHPYIIVHFVRCSYYLVNVWEKINAFHILFSSHSPAQFLLKLLSTSCSKLHETIACTYNGWEGDSMQCIFTHTCNILEFHEDWCYYSWKRRKMINDHRFHFFGISQVAVLDRHASTLNFQKWALKALHTFRGPQGVNVISSDF